VGGAAPGPEIHQIDPETGAILSDLKQVPSIECSSRMRATSIERTSWPVSRIDGVQLGPGREPHVLTIESHAMHGVAIPGNGPYSREISA